MIVFTDFVSKMIGDERHLRDVRYEQSEAEKRGQEAGDPIVRLQVGLRSRGTEREKGLTGTHVSDMVEGQQPRKAYVTRPRLCSGSSNHHGRPSNEPSGNTMLIPNHAPHISLVQLIQFPRIFLASHQRHLPRHSSTSSLLSSFLGLNGVSKKTEKDPEKVQAMYADAVKELAVIQRSSIVNQLYGGRKLVVEDQRSPDSIR
jgi:hypothetical protein